MFGWLSADAAWAFKLKAHESLRVARKTFGQELEGDKTMQPCVLGFINHTHPAAAQFFDNAVMRDVSPIMGDRVQS
jgi:hypothetical protein